LGVQVGVAYLKFKRTKITWVKRCSRGLFGFIFCLAVVLMHPRASASPLVDEISSMLESHERLSAAGSDVSAAVESTGEARGAWAPEVSVSSSYGYESQNNGESDDTSMPPREISLSLTRTLWDFGLIDANIDRAALGEKQSRQSLDATRQQLILEGIQAYLEVMRAYKLVGFARESVTNIKHQAELEDSRVQRGAGATTDVLQAKRQLAGAESRLTQATGTLKISHNRYRAVFGHDPGSMEELYAPKTPFVDVPGTLEAAIRDAFEANPELLASSTGVDIARKDVNVTDAEEFYPTISASADHTIQEDFSGTAGRDHETLIKVELTYDFNLGGAAMNTLRAAEHSSSAAVSRYADERNLVEERVRNAWDSLGTAQTNAGHLVNQADIAAEFLELARRERQLGERSLIDVLAGETALINANSDATSSHTDVALAVYSLLAAMGRLEVDLLK
jgi:TolC family type I secretion outer membrane protein